MHIAGPENRARGSLSSVVRRRVFLQLGAHLPKERYAYAARKSSAKFRYSYNWLSPGLPFSSPNDLSISHSQRVSRKVSRSLAASLDSYENVPEGTRLAGPKSDPEPAGTRLQQSGITVRACVRYPSANWGPNSTKHQPTYHNITFPIWRASRQQLNNCTPEQTCPTWWMYI